MTTHVFIGAGPANLDRALKIRKRDPEAQFIFIDKRVSPAGELDREYSRANIFRFPLSERDKILENGVDKEAFARLSTERDFSEQAGFQFGDTQVFGNERFTQIQIRDIQQLYLDQLKKSGNISFLDVNVDLEQFYHVRSDSHIKEVVLKSMKKERDDLKGHLETEKNQIRFKYLTETIKLMESIDKDENIFYHNAVGALQEGPKGKGTTQDSMIYPPKSQITTINIPSVDLSAMPVTAMHGTTTFSLTDSGIDPKDFVGKTLSLDNTAWQVKLGEHGWNLYRPPRVRLFYANDTLYIGVEVPASFAQHVKDGRPDETYKMKQAAYARTIAKLMLPDFSDKIETLPANGKGVNAPSFFLTSRGESGHVIEITEDSSIIINHGDTRYLPHYQTGSGFVTATFQNDAYVDIYLKKSFKELYDWAKEAKHVEKDYQQTFNDYAKAVGVDVSKHGDLEHKLTPKQEKKMLKLFQGDLYIFVTHEVLAENKVKVDKYFTQIQKQALSLLSTEENFRNLVQKFKSIEEVPHHMHVVQHFNPDQSINENLKPVVIMEMLIHGSNDFLLEVLPKLINVDLTNIDLENSKDVEKLHKLRNAFTNDYTKYINCKGILETLDPIVKKELFLEILGMKSNLNVAVDRIADILGVCPSLINDLEQFTNQILKQNPVLTKECKNELFCKALTQKYSNKSAQPYISFAKLHILDKEVSTEHVQEIARTIKESFDNRPDLLRGRFFGGFFNAGTHALRITKLKQNLGEIAENGDKQQLTDVLLQFQEELVKNNSVRTIVVLKEAVDSIQSKDHRHLDKII